jgi:hypothetical protein
MANELRYIEEMQMYPDVYDERLKERGETDMFEIYCHASRHCKFPVYF